MPTLEEHETPEFPDDYAVHENPNSDSDRSNQKALLFEGILSSSLKRVLPCEIEGTIRLQSSVNEYSVQLVKKTVFGSVYKGVSIRPIPGQHKITVKHIVGGLNVSRDWAALKTLDGSGIAPILFDVDSRSVPRQCIDQVFASSYHGYHVLSDLWKGVALKPADLRLLARRGIDILRTLHAHGIVHGSIGFSALRYMQSGSMEKQVASLRLVDFDYAKVWTKTYEGPQLPPHLWLPPRILDEDGLPRGRREDVLGFMECIMYLAREGPLRLEGLTGGQVVDLKRRFAIEEAFKADKALYSVFRRIYDLANDETPQYSEYIDQLSV